MAVASVIRRLQAMCISDVDGKGCARGGATQINRARLRIARRRAEAATQLGLGPAWLAQPLNLARTSACAVGVVCVCVASGAEGDWLVLPAVDGGPIGRCAGSEGAAPQRATKESSMYLVPTTADA